MHLLCYDPTCNAREAAHVAPSLPIATVDVELGCRWRTLCQDLFALHERLRQRHGHIVRQAQGGVVALESLPAPLGLLKDVISRIELLQVNHHLVPYTLVELVCRTCARGDVERSSGSNMLRGGLGAHLEEVTHLCMSSACDS